MTFKEIQELLKLIKKLELTEFKMKDGELEISVRTKHYEKVKQQTVQVQPVPQQQPVMQVPPSMSPGFQPGGQTAPPASASDDKADDKATPQANQDDDSNYVPIKSPIVGTFYRSSSPDKPVYVKVGDTISEGSVVCIVEAMKLFNEIESEISGKIVKVMVEDAQPVEYDQVLFLVDPKG